MKNSEERLPYYVITGSSISGYDQAKHITSVGTPLTVAR